MLEPLDQRPVALDELGQQLVRVRIGMNLELADLRETPIRRDDDLERAGLPMPPRILARPVDVEIVVGMLDDRHPLSGERQAPDQLLDERGLAGAGIAAEADDPHHAFSAMKRCTAPTSAFIVTKRRGRFSRPCSAAGRGGSTPIASTMDAANLAGSAVSSTTIGTPG